MAMEFIPFDAQHPWLLSGLNFYKEDIPKNNDPTVNEICETINQTKWGRNFTYDILWRRNVGWKTDIVLLDWGHSSTLFNVDVWLVDQEWLCQMSGRELLNMVIDNPTTDLVVEKQTAIDLSMDRQKRLPITDDFMVIKNRKWKFSKRGSSLFLVETN